MPSTIDRQPTSRGYNIIIVETNADANSEVGPFAVPQAFSVLSVKSTLVSGTGTTVNPSMGVVAGWSDGDADEVFAALDGAPSADLSAVVLELGNSTHRRGYVRHNVDAGSDNEIHTTIEVAETSAIAIEPGLSQDEVDARVTALAPAIADARVVAGSRRGTQALTFTGAVDALTEALELGYGQNMCAEGAPASNATLTGLETLPSGEGAMLRLTLAEGKTLALSGTGITLSQRLGTVDLATLAGDGSVVCIFLTRAGNVVEYTIAPATA